MSSFGRFGAGLVLGVAVAVLIGLVDAGEAPAAGDATTTTTAAPVTAATPWLEPGEVLIGATIVLPRGLTVDDASAFFDYDLAGLAPTLVDGADEDGELLGDPLAMPERWLLTTVAGESVEATTGPFDTSVRFALPSEAAQVERIALLGWRIPVPFGDRIELPIETGAVGEMRQGTVRIETVLEQSISTIVQIDFDHGGDLWDTTVLRPVDTRWRTSGRQGGGLQLIWEGDEPPTSVILEDAGFDMRPISGDLLVYEPEGAP